MDLFKAVLGGAADGLARELANAAAKAGPPRPLEGQILDNTLTIELLSRGSRKLCEVQVSGVAGGEKIMCDAVARAKVAGDQTGVTHCCAWHTITSLSRLVLPQLHR
jgi:hypothetical protein